MASEQELLEHARSNPADWDVYADWLQRQGDERGDLIALRLARGRPAIPRRPLTPFWRFGIGIGSGSAIGIHYSYWYA